MQPLKNHINQLQGQFITGTQQAANQQAAGVDDLALERGRRLAARLWQRLSVVPYIQAQGKTDAQARAWIDAWGAALAASPELSNEDLAHSVARVVRGDWDDSKPFSFREFRRLAEERVTQEQSRQVWLDAVRCRSRGDWSGTTPLVCTAAAVAGRYGWGDWQQASENEIAGRWHQLVNRIARGLEGDMVEVPTKSAGQVTEKKDHSAGLAKLRAWATQTLTGHGYNPPT